MKKQKSVTQMTLKEVQDFFEKIQHIVHTAYPEDKADQLMSDMSEAFFKTLSLESNKSGAFIDVRIKTFRVGQIVKLKSSGDRTYRIVDIDLKNRQIFLQPLTSKSINWYDIVEVEE